MFFLRYDRYDRASCFFLRYDRYDRAFSSYHEISAIVPKGENASYLILSTSLRGDIRFG